MGEGDEQKSSIGSWRNLFWTFI